MSLVAYGSSSEDESDSSNEEISSKVEKPNANSNNQITDKSLGRRTLKLQPPKVIQNESEPDIVAKSDPEEFAIKLPKPSNIVTTFNILEEDDEFLHKKPNPKLIPIPKPPTIEKKGPVRIILPSLSEFKDDTVKKNKTFNTTNLDKSCGLLGLLPRPKIETILNPSFRTGDTSKKSNLIPHSVMTKNKTPTTLLKKQKGTLSKKKNSDSEESDHEEIEDFFSLNKEDTLPSVSNNEISAMIAKQAAKMAETSAKFNEMTRENSNNTEDLTYNNIEVSHTSNNNNNNRDLDDDVLQALCGSRAKRGKLPEEVNILDISSEQILPNKNAWMRNSLASVTEYQPRGRLVGIDEPSSGTKRKHQITYLAYQAKANEQELQAMWAESRQSRRQTQSKYGF